MTDNLPTKEPDDLEEKASNQLEENGSEVQGQEQEDLLFANIDALMDGTDTPVSEPVNLDDYPEETQDVLLDDIQVTSPESAESTEDDFIPVSEAGVLDLDMDEHAAESLIPVVEEEPPSDSIDFFEDLDGPTAEIVIPVMASDSPETEALSDAPIIELGFYGKLPTYGDFIQKRLPQRFINPWHEWVQASMLALRGHDSDGWLAYYLNCPAWCFVLGAGVCGESPIAGVTIPSVDRVGRYFNFSMASVLPDGTDPAVFAAARKQWFERLENLALSVLDKEMDQDGIDTSINENAAELSWGQNPRTEYENNAEHVRLISSESTGVGELLPALLHRLIENEHSNEHGNYGLWWHRGSSQVTPQLLSCASMPMGDTYLGLIMDRDLQDSAQPASQKTESDYMDELLSD
jgi:type VI secretion system protein ImpM